MDDVIDELRARAEVVPVPLTLPDDEELVEIEEALCVSLPQDLREFLLSVSDVVYGHLEPVTVTDPYSHTYLPEVAATAWAQGVSRQLIPLCEIPGGYDCVTPDGEVCRVTADGVKSEDENWPSVWHWVREVWLQP